MPDLQIQTLNQTMLLIMALINNHFIIRGESGHYNLSNNQIILQGDYKINQYIIISKAELVTGLYQITDKKQLLGNNNITINTILNIKYFYTLDIPYDTIDIMDEEFEGIIYGLRIPPTFINIAIQINDYINSSVGKIGPYTSETVISTHTWSKATNKDGLPVGWQDLFEDKLIVFRHVMPDLIL